VFEGITDPRAILSQFQLGDEVWSGVWTISVDGTPLYVGDRGAPITGRYYPVDGGRAGSAAISPAPSVRSSTACIAAPQPLPPTYITPPSIPACKYRSVFFVAFCFL
jgi:hypothetical protein